MGNSVSTIHQGHNGDQFIPIADNVSSGAVSSADILLKVNHDINMPELRKLETREDIIAAIERLGAQTDYKSVVMLNPVPDETRPQLEPYWTPTMLFAEPEPRSLAAGHLYDAMYGDQYVLQMVDILDIDQGEVDTMGDNYAIYSSFRRYLDENKLRRLDTGVFIKQDPETLENAQEIPETEVLH